VCFGCASCVRVCVCFFLGGSHRLSIAASVGRHVWAAGVRMCVCCECAWVCPVGSEGLVYVFTAAFREVSALVARWMYSTCVQRGEGGEGLGAAAVEYLADHRRIVLSGWGTASVSGLGADPWPRM
jgi:hypothetical protein